MLYDLNNFLKLITLGDKNGNWNNNVMQDVLCKRTYLRLRLARLSRRKTVFPVPSHDVLRYVADKSYGVHTVVKPFTNGAATARVKRDNTTYSHH